MIFAQKLEISDMNIFPMDDKETVLSIDSWKDQRAIDVHHASFMMSQIARLRENMTYT